tara:strand:+ start:11383 stop:12786 length:1404 start_codon:yes stop_codon:yes gene_type:complete
LIPITRKLVKTLRSVFRAALGLTAQSNGTPLHVKTGPDGLVISAAMFGLGIRYHLDGSFSEHEFWLPFEFLKETEGNRNDAVLLDPTSDGIVIQWVVDSVPQTRTFHVQDAPDAITLPEVDFTDNPPELLVALAEAARTCDHSSTRYALSCIQLRGEAGEVVATDSHQLLVEGGFSFPWDDNVLIPGGKLLTHREFRTDQEVGIGRAEDVVVLKAGPWTAWMSIDKERRFPEIDQVIPNVDAAIATVSIPKNDGDFLARVVKQLPANDEHHSPVTVDLNGSIAVRARTDCAKVPTELVLTRSSRTGDPVRFSTNRKLLARAMQLGFDGLHIFGPDSPVLCMQANRKFVWMLLDKDGAIKPSKEAIRIESAATTAPTNKTSANTIPTAARNPTPMKPTNSSRNTASAKATQPDNSPSLIDRAESLRDSLHAALADTRNLITTLKQQQKASRSVQSALKSLRQLETLEV